MFAKYVRRGIICLDEYEVRIEDRGACADAICLDEYEVRIEDGYLNDKE